MGKQYRRQVIKAQPSFHDGLHDVEVDAKRKRYLWGLQPPLCYRQRNLFVYMSRIARSSRRNWVGLYDVSVRYTVALVVLSTCNIFPQLSWVGCSFQGKLFSISKLLCLVFVTYYLSFCTALENLYSLLFHLDLREKISSAIKDFVYSPKPSTYPGSARVQCGLHGRSMRFPKHSPSLHKRVSVIGLYCYHINCIHVLVLCSHFEKLWKQSNCWTYMYWSCLLTTWQY